MYLPQGAPLAAKTHNFRGEFPSGTVSYREAGQERGLVLHVVTMKAFPSYRSSGALELLGERKGRAAECGLVSSVLRAGTEKGGAGAGEKLAKGNLLFE